MQVEGDTDERLTSLALGNYSVLLGEAWGRSNFFFLFTGNKIEITFNCRCG